MTRGIFDLFTHHIWTTLLLAPSPEKSWNQLISVTLSFELATLFGSGGWCVKPNNIPSKQSETKTDMLGFPNSQDVFIYYQSDGPPSLHTFWRKSPTSPKFLVALFDTFLWPFLRIEAARSGSSCVIPFNKNVSNYINQPTKKQQNKIGHSFLKDLAWFQSCSLFLKWYRFQAFYSTVCTALLPPHQFLSWKPPRATKIAKKWVCALNLGNWQKTLFDQFFQGRWYYEYFYQAIWPLFRRNWAIAKPPKKQHLSTRGWLISNGVSKSAKNWLENELKTWTSKWSIISKIGFAKKEDITSF